MGKYHDEPLTVNELTEICSLINTLNGLELLDITLDHIQVGDLNGDILGKLQFAIGTDGQGWFFHPRKDNKPGVLGE